MSWIEKKNIEPGENVPWLEIPDKSTLRENIRIDASPLLGQAMDKLSKIKSGFESKVKNPEKWLNGVSAEKIKSFVWKDEQPATQNITVEGGFFKVGFVFEQDENTNSYTLTPAPIDTEQTDLVEQEAPPIEATASINNYRTSFQRIHLGIHCVPLEHVFGWMKLTPSPVESLDPTVQRDNQGITDTDSQNDESEIVESTVDQQFVYSQELKAEPTTDSYTINFPIEPVGTEPAQPAEDDDSEIVVQEKFVCTTPETEKPRIFFERTGPAVIDLVDSEQPITSGTPLETELVYKEQNNESAQQTESYFYEPSDEEQLEAEQEPDARVTEFAEPETNATTTEPEEEKKENHSIPGSSLLSLTDELQASLTSTHEESSDPESEAIEPRINLESKASIDLELDQSNELDNDLPTNQPLQLEPETHETNSDDCEEDSRINEPVQPLDAHRPANSDLQFDNDTDDDSMQAQSEPKATQQESTGDRASITPQLHLAKQYEMPFHMLSTSKKKAEIKDPVEAQAIIQKLETTLDQFGVEARVIGIQSGPIITRYELKPAPGIKVNKILALTDELAMALEALRVRIEAPIPGRSTVGIELPNKQRSPVLLGDLIQTEAFKDGSGELRLPMGKDISGTMIFEDLTKMPHILVAGATGSGKSVLVNSFITSLVMDKGPDQVRFILVDPKLVELSQYNEIPHLLHPVITDHTKAIQALNWAVEEMERRYEDLAEFRVRDIRTYNEKVKTWNQKYSDADPMMPMPYIVVLIDELGDLMMVAGKEVEASIIRLSQKARAVGIHLILATQRPSVDVITALIKANCPARIALQVAQKTDSRTILDSNGADQLLGQGDMLFKHPAKAQLIRIQAPYVKDEEVEEVVKKAKRLGKPSYITLEDPKADSSTLEAEEEELFDEAWEIIQESGKASASYLQRRLRIGYNRAARLIEAFEARGFIGPQVGSKPREILI